MPYPYGITDIRRQDLIDMDECGVELSSTDRKIEKSLIGQQVSQMGSYSKTTKFNLLIAISVNPINPHRWCDMWTGEGITVQRMIALIQQIINNIGIGTPDRMYTFTMDNLRYGCMLLLLSRLKQFVSCFFVC